MKTKKKVVSEKYAWELEEEPPTTTISKKELDNITECLTQVLKILGRNKDVAPAIPPAPKWEELYDDNGNTTWELFCCTDDDGEDFRYCIKPVLEHDQIIWCYCGDEELHYSSNAPWSSEEDAKEELEMARVKFLSENLNLKAEYNPF